MGLPPFHQLRWLSIFANGISHVVLHGILDLGDGKLIKVFLQAIILELLMVMEDNLANLESNGLKQKTSRASLLGNNTLHLVGLLSDSGVHSRLDQLQLLLNRASERGAKKIRVYVLTDGRDVLDGSSVGFPENLKRNLQAYAARALMHRLLLVKDDECEVVNADESQVRGEAHTQESFVIINEGA
ncbi:2,3-bisphosphoglycerate-independent phosphoglycerate mutase [Tanacetum coccineum]